MEDVKNYYGILAKDANIAIQLLTKKIWWIGSFRFLTILAGGIGIWMFWGNIPLVVGIFVVSLIIFLLLIKVHERYFKMRGLQKNYVKIAQDNERRLKLDLNGLATGEEYIDTRHPYSYDLDIFGKKSIFSLLDTTCYAGGAKRLANYLAQPSEIIDDIANHQEAIKELREMNDLRNRFRAFGMEINKDLKGIVAAVEELPKINMNPIWKYLTIIWFPIMIVGLLLMIFDVVSPMAFGGLFVVGVVIGTIQSKMITAKHKELTALVEEISSFSPLFEEIENGKFNSACLQNIQKSLSDGTLTASLATKELNNIVRNLDQRYNVVGLLILNGFLLWDYKQMVAAQKWLEKSGESVFKWQDLLSTFDALSALATFSFNNPSYIFPELDKSGNTILEGENLGHPLISKERCVCNGVRNIKNGNFLVITGANMAGKSTYLRTIGVNYILASIGAPVFATKMEFTPVTLCTGLRTTDSLQENESYFFAELFRLRSIIERAEKGERIFVILDEILKGTNSVDKQKGSLGLIRKFVTHNVAGIIATHDLMLGTLADEFPDNVSNYCFEAAIKGDKLEFSYQIHQGIAQNMNAYFLMRKMGIVN